MEQYLNLLRTIKSKGTHKDAARPGMPGTTSLFGYQFRHNLADGFPLITTKKVSIKMIATELLWFLQGQTHIKYLIDHGCNIWNEDAYNYYVKIASRNNSEDYNPIYLETEHGFRMFTFEEFVKAIQTTDYEQLKAKYSAHGYILGDCGMQYGKLWRNWNGLRGDMIKIKTTNISADEAVKLGEMMSEFMKTGKTAFIDSRLEPEYVSPKVDQLYELIDGLRKNPLSRRHIITAWNPTTLADMALNACHAMVQFNCRPLSLEERIRRYDEISGDTGSIVPTSPTLIEIAHQNCDQLDIPKYYLDCQLYQRSADAFLGVPFNIASYAMLTHFLASICNMIPGDYIHSFGDVHIYDNHQEQVDLQLSRDPHSLPELLISPWIKELWSQDINSIVELNKYLDALLPQDFGVDKYNPHPAIKGDLSTGLQK